VTYAHTITARQSQKVGTCWKLYMYEGFSSKFCQQVSNASNVTAMSTHVISVHRM